MKFFGMLSALWLAIFPAATQADTISDKLAGTWIETEGFNDSPRVVLHFKGRKVRFENLYDRPATVDYQVSEEKPDSFRVSFEYRYKVKRGNVRIVEYTERPEFRFHEEKGRPILSESVFEADGRGTIILREFLRQEDFIDGFTSELKRQLNARPFPPMMMQ